MKKKNLKRSLLLSVLSLLLCVSMFVGTTFAWFSETITNQKNKIMAGNLDVALYYMTEDMADWEEVDENTVIFPEDALWEPGYTQVVYFKVVNEGTLALKYQFGLSVLSKTTGTNVDGDTFKLSEFIKFGVVEGDEHTPFADRADAIAKVDANSKKISEGFTKPGELVAATATTPAEEYVSMAVYMPTTVGNEANYKTGTVAPTINLGIELYATQMMNEEDAFGPDYDEDSWVTGMKVYNAQDLQAAINAGETKIVLMDDIDLTETIVIPAAASTLSATTSTTAVVINLNGKTVTANVTAFKNYGELVIEGDGVIDITSATAETLQVIDNYASLTLNGGEYRGAKTMYSYAIRSAGTLTVNDAVVEGGFGGIAVQKGSAAVINGGSFSNSMDEGAHVMIAWADTVVEINGGSFVGHQQANNNYQYAVIGISTANIVINGGNFVAQKQASGNKLMFSGNVTVKAGTFDVDVSALVVAGMKTVQSGDVYYVVDDEVAAVVTDPTHLKDALTSAGAAGAGDTTIAFFGDIDMTGATWTPIKVDGYHGADIVTIEGNGATITGLTAPLFAGGFAGGSGIVIKDLTIADSNIVSSNTLGSGAFIESVDSMAKIELKNCHLVNSTVTGGKGSRTGGLIGWTAGYNNENDGPVKTYVTIEDCSVIGCTITCDGSVGGIYGHAGNNAWTYSTVKNCVVKNNVLNSTDDGGWRVGVAVGTANVGELTISGITESGNTLTQTGKTAPAGQSNLYGRFVPNSTGKLVIDGAEVVISATSLKNTLDNAEAGDVVIANGVVIEGTTQLNKPGVTVIGATFKNENGIAVRETISGTYKDCVFEGSEALRWCYTKAGDTVVFENCEIKTDFRGVHFDGMQGDVVFKNCKINGFNAIGGEGTVTFEGCTFGYDESSYNGLNMYSNINLIDCTFNYVSGKTNFIDMEGIGKTLTISNCTAILDGVETNIADFVGGSKLAQNTVVIE